MPDGTKWDTEKPISEKKYRQYLLEGDPELSAVHKTKYRFVFGDCRFEIDVYPFCTDKAVMFRYSDKEETFLPPEVEVIKEVTGDPTYKNKQLAIRQAL